MASLNQLAYNIARTLGKQEDEAMIEKLRTQIVMARAMLIRQSYERHNVMVEQFVQDLDCVTLEEAKMTECCNVTIPGCTVRRTPELPVPITLQRNVYFKYVGGTDKVHELSYIFPESIDDLAYLRYAGPWRWYTYLDNRIFTITKQSPGKLINIRGVFENPRAAAKFVNCSGQPCYTDDDDFPISGAMEQMVTDILLKQEGRFIQLINGIEVQTDD